MAIDVVAGIGPDQVSPLVEGLASEFYADAGQIADSLQRGKAFNVIHRASGYKFDLFPLRREPYYQAQFERREMTVLPVPGEAPLAFAVASAEDTILAKLVWYRAGGELSERQ